LGALLLLVRRLTVRELDALPESETVRLPAQLLEPDDKLLSEARDALLVCAVSTPLLCLLTLAVLCAESVIPSDSAAWSTSSADKR
jgi:hypothetical protein